MMDLAHILASEHSKASTETIVRWVGSSQPRFDNLFAHFCGKDARIAQVAGWPLGYCVEKHPELITPHWQQLMRVGFGTGNHESVKRNTLRMLQYADIPESFHGQVMTICFDIITSPTEKPAAKAFALTVLDNLSKTYPEISDELRLIIETQWASEKPAFRARAKRFLNKKPGNNRPHHT